MVAMALLAVLLLLAHLAKERGRAFAVAQVPLSPGEVSGPQTTPAVPGGGLKKVSKDRRAQLVQDMARARGQGRVGAAHPAGAARGLTRAVGKPAGSSLAENAVAPGERTYEVGPLDKQYIRSRVQELIPLVQECYENELPENDRPSGTLLLHFTLEGEPEVGGIVGESEVKGGSLADRKDFVQCVVETMFTLEFEPPEEGGFISVDYPLTFESVPEDPSQSAKQK